MRISVSLTKCPFPILETRKQTPKKAKIAKVKNHFLLVVKRWKRGSIHIIKKISIIALVPQKTKAKIYHVYYTKCLPLWRYEILKYHFISFKRAHVKKFTLVHK